MGNVHEVIQTEPWRSAHGAAIAFHGEPTTGEPPSYARIAQAGRDIGRSRLGTGKLYACVQTGGKWGYGDDLEAWLGEQARRLCDACFYIQDEVSCYVQEWRIAGGRLSVEHVEESPSHVGLHLVRARPEHRAFGVELLVDHLDGTWFFSAPEPHTVQARAVAALREHAPERWETWYLAAGQAHALATDRERPVAEATRAAQLVESVRMLERALARAPDEEHARIEVRLLRVLADEDPARALALGRARTEAWIAAAARRPAWCSQIPVGFESYAELEYAYGDPVRAVRAYMTYVRLLDDDRELGLRLYDIACVRAAADRVDEARDWLRAAVLIEPARAGEVATDGDLAALHGPGLAALLDPDRDGA